MFKIQDTLCTHCNFCGEGGPRLCYAARTAIHGLEGNCPSKDDTKSTMFGRTQSAGEQFHPGVPRYKSLRDIVFVPELLGSARVDKKNKIGAEPLYIHCDTHVNLGGFDVKSPIIVAAMGSTPVANSIGIDLGVGAAKGGFVYAIGENILNMWGYDQRLNPEQPTLQERIRGFTDHCTDGRGGVLIQQNVEDHLANVWKTVYADPALAQAFELGVIGFEAKGGQGAKPGMGGEVKLKQAHAQRLYKMYHFPVNPFEVEQSLYQRHSVPGTATPESMLAQLEWMCQSFPKAKIWWKTGPYGDLMTQIEILDTVARRYDKRMHMTIDGTEGGTGMSPLGPMNDMGLPTLTCLMAIAAAKAKGYTHIDYSLAGGLVTGRDMTKTLALGADGIAFGKAFLIAAMAGRSHFTGDNPGEHECIQAGARGVCNYGIEGVTNEARMLISSIGKYDVPSIKPHSAFHAGDQEVVTLDVIALDEQVAKMFRILYAYDAELWTKLSEATRQLRQRNGVKEVATA